MDDIANRLKDCAAACLKSYESWEADKNTTTRENLQETIHDLRKVASRVEIEIAMSEREKTSGKPLPIPSHRSNSKSKGPVESILPDEGNTDGSHIPSTKKDGGARRQRPRRPMPKNNDN